MSSYNNMFITNMAKPLHIQRLESYLDMRPFLQYARQTLAQPLDSSESECDEKFKSNGHATSSEEDLPKPGLVKSKARKLQKLGTKEERENLKSHVYNFNDLTSDREWLYETLLSDTESESNISDEDEYIRSLLKSHISEQKRRENFYKHAKHAQYAYYGSGMLSNHDLYSDSKQSGTRRKRKRRLSKNNKPYNMKKLYREFECDNVIKSEIPDDHGEIDSEYLQNYAFGHINASGANEEHNEFMNYADTNNHLKNMKMPALMVARRRRMWQLMAKKEIGRCHRYKANNHKESLQNCKRVATLCMKLVRQRAVWSQKVMKETMWRAKRLTREMLSYWKRYERVERDTRRRMEREAEEQRKIDVEIIEAKRQQRKLNFLITQTELYAHFMSKKLGHGTEEEQLRILNQLDEEVNPRLTASENYDPEYMKQLAMHNAQTAVDTDRNKARLFDIDSSIVSQMDFKTERDSNELSKDLPQPSLFQGQLKSYQIKGNTNLLSLQ